MIKKIINRRGVRVGMSLLSKIIRMRGEIKIGDEGGDRVFLGFYNT